MSLPSRLFVTDHHASLLRLAGAGRLAYTPFGYCACEENGRPSVQFNGQYHEPLGGHYLLGNGYRLFNSVLMRFNSPDSLSPFGEGGMNAYVYCHADPVNGIDPSGHVTTLKSIVRKPLKAGRNPLVPRQAPAFGARTTPLHADGEGWFYNHLIEQTNSIVSRRMGPQGSVRTVVADISTESIDVANTLLSARKTPFMELVVMADYGTRLQKNIAVQLLDEVTGSSYRALDSRAKATLLEGVQAQLRGSDYPDYWYRRHFEQAQSIRGMEGN